MSVIFYRKVCQLIYHGELIYHLKNGRISVEGLHAAQQHAINVHNIAMAVAISQIIIHHDGPSVIDREAAIMLSYIKYYEATKSVAFYSCNFIISEILLYWKITDQSIIADLNALSSKLQ
jgi:hypothetical protein